MNEHKFTDDEIIKALEQEIHLTEYVDSDYADVKLEIIKSALDIIGHQKEEIEFFRKTISKNDERALQVTLEEIEKSRVKAITEFAERLKENITKSIDNYWNNNANGYYLAEDVLEEIDILVKEMIGDTE